MWQGGAAPAGDATANIYFATGNGNFDVDSGGVDFGDSILKLAMVANSFSVRDYFTPYDQATFNAGDVDLGSGGVLLLPDQPVGSPHTHLLVLAGKSGSIYLVDRDQMGKFNANTIMIVQTIVFAVGGVWGMPAWFNNTVFLGGSGDKL